jgi:hypothetical protein
MKIFFYIIITLFFISIKYNEIEENYSKLFVKLYDINDNIENLLQTDNNQNLNLYKIKTSYSKEELNELFSEENINSSKNKKDLKKLKKEIKEEKKLHKKEDKLLVEQMDKEKNSSIIKKPLDEYIQKENVDNKFLNYKLSTNDLRLNEESFSYVYSILLFLIVIGLLLFGIQFIINKNENIKKEDYYEFETDKLLKSY